MLIRREHTPARSPTSFSKGGGLQVLIVDQHVQQRLSLVPDSGGGKALFAAADASSARLVSCDRRDLVSRGLAILPADALISTERPAAAKGP